MKKKKIVVSIILLAVLVAFAIGGVVGLSVKGSISAYIDPNGPMMKQFFGALAFQGGTYGVVGGALAYLGVAALILVIVMAIAKKDGHYVINGVTALIALALAGYASGKVALSEGKQTVVTVMLVATAVLAVYGIAAMLCGVCFPKKAEAPMEPKPIPVEVEPSAEPEEEPAEEQKEEPAKEEPVEEPAEEEKPVEEPEPEEKPEEPTEEEKPVEEPEPEEKPEEPVEEEKPAEEPVKEEAVEEKPAPKAKKPAKKAKEPAPKAEEPAKKEEPAPVVAEETPKTKILGKYEVFPEAGFYKYRLKANNGEILIVSQGYKTKASAISGIETFKKNAETGAPKVVVDKNGFGQWRLFTGNDARMIAAGEIYPNEKSATSALASMQRFYKTEKVVVLDEIPEEEHREWTVELAEISPNENGKLEISQVEKKFTAALRANNGQLLFQTATYASRTGLLSGIEKVKAAAEKGNITIARDKQNRFQFRVFADNGMMLVMGETYPAKERAISAANSMRNFLGGAKVVDAPKEE